MFREARHIYKWFLKAFGYVAVVNPFSGTCHILEGYYPPGKKLEAHELEHLAQIKREGVIKFCLKYLWYLIRYGYKNNPYEVEARKAGEEALRKYTR